MAVFGESGKSATLPAAPHPGRRRPQTASRWLWSGLRSPVTPKLWDHLLSPRSVEMFESRVPQCREPFAPRGKTRRPPPPSSGAAVRRRGEGGRFPATTTSTLISHMDSGFRDRNAPNMTVRVMRNAARGGRKGVKTRFALTAGKVAEFPDRAEFINAQSSRFQICAIAL